MRVLEDHHHRLLARQTLELPDQRLQRPFLLPLRTEVRQRVALRSRQRQQIGEERHILLRRRGAGQQASSFSSLAAGGSSRANPAARPSWSMNGYSALSW